MHRMLREQESMALLHDMNDRLAAMEARQNRPASLNSSNGNGNGYTVAERALPPGWITRCASAQLHSNARDLAS